MQYGGQLGGQYGGKLGGNYGPQYHGRRLDLTPPGASTPRERLDAILSVEIAPEHTAISEMSIEIPPIDGIDAQTYEGGQMAYHIDGRLIFTAEIDDISVADDYTLSLSGPAVEDAPLDHDEYIVSYEEISTADAIEDFLTRLPYESVVHSAPPRPLTNRLVQRASEAGDFEAMLQAGSDVDENSLAPIRDIPDEIMRSAPPEYIPSLHPTSPLQVRPEGLTTTQTTVFTEGEDATDYECYFTGDGNASGGQAAIIINKGNFVKYDFAFVHDIPKNNFNVAYRAKIGSAGPDPHDRLEFSLDGQVLTTQYTPRFVNYPGGYRWYIARVTYDDVLEARDVAAGDDPHELKIEKVEGDDEVFIDCVAFRDQRFGFGTSLNETVDSNGALDGPQLYPDFLPVVFDQPAVGADISYATWGADLDVDSDHGSIGIAAPVLDDAVVGGYITSSDVTVQIEYDLPNSETITTVYGVVFIDNYTDPNRTKSPKTDTERQVLQRATLQIDGVEHSIINNATEYQGTALSILQDLHSHANRNFVIEHGVETGQTPRFDSFVKGDQSLVAGESDDWIITSENRDITDNGDVNTVHVIGAQAPNGTYYQGVARDEAAIAQLDQETPDSDNGVRSVELREKSLTSDNDCLSKARTELHERSRLSIGGDLDVAPILLDPGYPYRIQAFDTSDITDEEVGYGLNYGKYYGVGSLGVTSSLESISYSVSADGASTSLSFERPDALLRTIESIVETPDERPTPVRDTPPVVSSADPYPHPEDDDGGTPPGTDPGDDGPGPTATFSYRPFNPDPGETIEFNAAASGDEGGSIVSYEWDFGDGATATGQAVTHSYATAGEYAVSLTVTDNDGLTDTATYSVTVGTGGTEDSIAYLSTNPLENADYRVGGSAGTGTHGGNNVERPAAMPTRAEADYIVATGNDLESAINSASAGAIIYIDDDCDISGFSDVSLPRNCKLVAGHCDPNRTENGGLGPRLINHDTRPYNRRHLIASGPVELWGVVFAGPRSRFGSLEQRYFDPRDYNVPESDFYVSALWCYPDQNDGEALIYGCRFDGWNVAGLEAGERTTPSNVRVERSTFVNNCMETLGYGVEQWNGHLDMDLCYFDFNRHSISGYGYDTESWVVRNSMHGPNAISHAFDMHGLRQNEPDFSGNLAGKFCKMENVTIPFTEEHIRNPGSGQEGFRIRGVSDQTTTIDNCHFYHPSAPDPPGQSGDAFWQTYPGQPNSFVNLTYSNNQYGTRLAQGIGCPLNAPVEPQQS